MARILAFFTGAVIIVFAAYVALAPGNAGTLGMHVSSVSGALIVSDVTPGGPAARAGVRHGDTLDLSSVSRAARICVVGEYSCRLRTAYSFAVSNGGNRTFNVTPAPTVYDDPSGRYIDFVLNVMYVAFAFIVILKAPKRRLSTVLVWMMLALALWNVTADFNSVATSPALAYAFNMGLQDIVVLALGVLVVLAICDLDVGMAALRARVSRFAFPIAIVCHLALFIRPFKAVSLVVGFDPPRAFDLFALGVSCAASLCMVVLTLVLVHSATPENRVRSRWFASTLVVCFYLAVPLYWVNQLVLNNDVLSVVTYYGISFTLVGPIYATLRHHLVDLDVVLSRSAVVATVSVALLLAFVGAEWIASKVSDALVGGGRWHGVTAQALSFGVAVGVGLFFRQMHSRTERSVNAMFFRDRERKLRLLQNFAREADLIDSREALLKVTFDALVDSLETTGVALYVADSRNFACVRTSTPSAPERLDRCERPILRMLRDPQAFTNEVAPLFGWLIVPLMARADVIGFIACAPKTDRTRYLAEELSALQSVTHHVGTSYAMLPVHAIVSS